jgi:tRNA (uracil-5-)-methyltransferase TRM9
MNFIEENYVLNVYNEISESFSNTRYNHWNYVKNFLIKIKEENKEREIKFLDLGCGNGKYLSFCEDYETYAVDNSENLLKIVKERYPKVNIINSDVTSIFNDNRSNYFDYIISIAVIHHLSDEKRRINMINEMIKLLKKEGKGLISAWSINIDKEKYKKIDDKNNYLIPWQKKYERYYHLFEKNELKELLLNFKEEIIIEDEKEECNNWIILFRKI